MSESRHNKMFAKKNDSSKKFKLDKNKIIKKQYRSANKEGIFKGVSEKNIRRIESYKLNSKDSFIRSNLESISEIDKQITQPSHTQTKFQSASAPKKGQLLKKKKDDQTEQPAKPQYIPPDGGWGWLVCLSAFITTVSFFFNFLKFI